MSSPLAKPPLRNAPCPCGSGKKYKHCCGLVAETAASPQRPGKPTSRRDTWLTVLGLVGLVVATIFALVSVNRRTPAPVAGASSLLPGGRVPQAWEFDPVNNRHWDPSHNHWHDGPAPTGAAAADTAAAAAAAAVGK